MITKRYLSPKLATAISILAASGCFAAVPNYEYQRNKRAEVIPTKQVRVVAAQPLPAITPVSLPHTDAQPNSLTGEDRPATQPLPVHHASVPHPAKTKDSTSHNMEETHKNITTRSHLKQEPVKKEEPVAPTRLLPPTKTDLSPQPKAEQYKKRLAALKNAYTSIAAKAEQVDGQDDDDDDDDDDNDTNENVVAFESPKQLLALSSPYGEQGYDEERQDWGSQVETSKDLEKEVNNDLEPTTESLPEDEGYRYEEEEGFLVNDRSNSHDHVAQTEGRREEARNLRTETVKPVSEVERSTISTDRVRRSRVPKSSVQRERQRQATNSLRNKIAKQEQPKDEPLYYEDYLSSIADEYEQTKNAQERKPYTKPRRRLVNRNDETAAVNVIQTHQVSTRTSRQLAKEQTENQNDQPKRDHLKKRVRSQQYEEPVAEPPVVAPQPVKPTPAPIKKLSVHQPKTTQSTKTYIPHHQSLKQQPVAVGEPDDDEEDGDEEDAEVTDRSERPNWYDRMDGQRRERSIQRRVRALDGQNPRPRGYPTIPEYTQGGNTTPKS